MDEERYALEKENYQARDVKKSNYRLMREE